MLIKHLRSDALPLEFLGEKLNSIEYDVFQCDRNIVLILYRSESIGFENRHFYDDREHLESVISQCLSSDELEVASAFVFMVSDRYQRVNFEHKRVGFSLKKQVVVSSFRLGGGIDEAQFEMMKVIARHEAVSTKLCRLPKLENV